MLKSMSTIFVLALIISNVKLDLIGVVQINRHGARAPSNFHKIASKMMHGSNNFQLTINGYQQHELLGQWIAERYMHYDYNLLSSKYCAKETLFKASPEERTIFSGIAFIKGMFPKSNINPNFMEEANDINFAGSMNSANSELPILNFQLRENSLNAQIPLHIFNPKNDKVFHSQHCRVNQFSQVQLKHLLLEKQIFNITHEEVIEAIDEIRSQAAFLFKGKTDSEIYSKKFFKELTAFIIPVQFHTKNKFLLLSETTLALVQKFQIQKWYGSRIDNSETKKMINSAMFYEILSYFDTFIQGNSLKFVLYSGHDSNIIGILSSLIASDTIMHMIENHKKFFNFLQPNFASSFIFELHRYKDVDNSEKHFVRILYNNVVVKEGFETGIVYNEHLNGIEFDSLKSFIFSLIDPNFENLVCNEEIANKVEEQVLSIDLEKNKNDVNIQYLNIS